MKRKDKNTILIYMYVHMCIHFYSNMKMFSFFLLLTFINIRYTGCPKGPTVLQFKNKTITLSRM